MIQGTRSHCLLLGDCLEQMGALEDDSIDAIVTDPPYGLSAPPDMLQVLSSWLSGEPYSHPSKGFMGKDWDSFVPGPEVWREAYRVLKPGGHMLAFFGTRTYDLGVLAIRLAGFEVRDLVAYCYGSGFPKNHDIGKAIDKMAGAEREVVGHRKTSKGDSGPQQYSALGVYTQRRVLDVTIPSTSEAQQWQGWGTALKPALEPVVLVRKPFPLSIAANVVEHGTGGINIEGCRIGSDSTIRPNGRTAFCPEGGGMKTAMGGSTAGRWPSNLLLQHSPGCVVVGEREQEGYIINRWKEGAKPFGDAGGRGLAFDGHKQPGATVPVYECECGCPVLLMGGQGGSRKGGTAADYFLNLPPVESEDYDPFFYSVKASQREKNAGLEYREEVIVNDGRDTSIDNPYQRGDTPRKNIHPTVKPIALMRYLCRLITPPGGMILDPFMGSGTTGIAALLEGFAFTGIERSPEYMEICEARISHWTQPPEGESDTVNAEGEGRGEKENIEEAGQDSEAEGLQTKPIDGPMVQESLFSSC